MAELRQRQKLPSDAQILEIPSSSDTTPAVPASTIRNLLVFVVLLFTTPLATYFLGVNTIFNGNQTFAGLAAAGMANLVLFAYLFVAFQESDEAEKIEKKSQ